VRAKLEAAQDALLVLTGRENQLPSASLREVKLTSGRMVSHPEVGYNRPIRRLGTRRRHRNRNLHPDANKETGVAGVTTRRPKSCFDTAPALVAAGLPCSISIALVSIAAGSVIVPTAVPL
jgi:hypothetical protein